MLAEYKPYWPENILMAGAGATASLGIQTTSELGKLLHTLILNESEERRTDWIASAFPGTDHKFQKYFAELLQLISNKTESFSFTKEKRAKNLQQIYDWHTLKLIARRCPIIDEGSLRLADIYNLIDLHLQSGHGFRVNDEFIKPERLQAARNTINMIIFLAHATSYQQILKNKKSEYRQYYEFARILAEKMKQEGLERRKQALDSREFYMFSYAVISMNWDPLLLWLIFNAHKELNDNRPAYIGSPALPLKLFNDMAHFMGVRAIGKNKIGAWYPMNETAVQRLNDLEHMTGRRVRVGKFYFPHGSSAFRECPNCGKLTCFLGDSWGYASKTLFPPHIIKIGDIHIDSRSKEEAKVKEDRINDAVQCIHCGAITEAHHSTMIMQTNFKGSHPPYIEEIQRDMRVAIENAKHIILFGYSFPSDDFIYHSIFAARKRLDDQLKCSIVGFDEKAPDKWLSGQKLKQYVEQNKKADVVKVYNNVKSLFNEKNIRLYGKGIPAVFLHNNKASKTKVDQLLEWS